MARPTGWDILGLDGDPTPGVVESVQALAKEFGDFAHDVESAYRSLNSFGSDAAALQWVGQTADAFKSNYGPLPGRLQKLYTSYSEASDALSAYAPKLQAAQAKADAALRQAQDANADLQRATTNANTAAADLKTAQQNHAVNPNPQAVTDAQTTHDTAQTNLTNAKDRMATLTAQAHQAHDDRIAAAKECAKAIGHAQSDGIHNKSWWDHVGEDLSKWGGEIAQYAGEVAVVLDVVAFATSWVPGLDVITAGLAIGANVLAGVATAGAVIQVGGDVMQGHWGDALLDGGLLVGTMVGGKLLQKFGGKLMDRIAARGDGAATKAGDPVDVVCGQMIADAVDVSLPGVLPLVLERAYASSYATGRLFGPGWSSSLDQRVAVTETGIHFAGDDARTLRYPLPTGTDEVLPEDGVRWPLVWDRATDEIRITDPETGHVRHFPIVHHTDDRGQIRDLTSLSDRNGNRIVFHRDTEGTPTAITTDGYRIAVDTAVSTAGTRVVALRLLGDDGSDAGISIKTFRYDELGRLKEIIDSSGVPYRYEYDTLHQITAWTDRVGFRYEYEYDEWCRVLYSVGVGGVLSARFAYDEAGHATTVTDSLGNATIYEYDEDAHITRISDPLGHAEIFAYDRYGRLLHEADQLGNAYRYDLDERGDLVRIARPDGGTVMFEYNEHHLPTRAVLPDGAVWQRRYDDHGNVVAVVDPLGAQTRYEYDERGRLAAVVDELGAATRYETDAAGLPIAVTDPLGAVTQVRRDVFGRVVESLDPLGNRTRTSWSTEGALLWRELPDGTREERAYDAAGNLVREIDAAGGVVSTEYGPFAKPVARTGQDGVRYAFAFDTELRLTAVTGLGRAGAADGRRWSYVYDAAGRLVGETDFDGRTLAYTPDPTRRLISRVNGAGQELRYRRDAAGRIVQTSADGEVLADYAFDLAGRLTRATSPGADVAIVRDACGRIVAEAVNGRTTATEYDAAGRRIRRTTPTGAVSEWSYDTVGRPRELATVGGRLAFGHDAAGRETTRRLGPAAVLTQTWDTVDRLIGQEVRTGTGDGAAAPASFDVRILGREFGYRADGYPLHIADERQGTRRFRLDPVGRVTGVDAGSWREEYAYDTAGAVVNASWSGQAGPQDSDVAATAGDRELAGLGVRRAGRTHYERDSQGRLIRVRRHLLSGQVRQWSYTWDAEDRLVQAETPDGAVWHYAYDALGRRVSKTRLSTDGIPTEQLFFSWDGSDLAEQSARAADGSWTALTWDFEPDTFAVAAQTRRTWVDGASTAEVDRAFHAIITDSVGTPTELIAPDGRIAWRRKSTLWGAPAEAAPSGSDAADSVFPLRFPGQYHDPETGMEYSHFRYYDSGTGTFASPDPLGLAPAPNPYTYVRNPLILADPLGLMGAQKRKTFYHPDGWTFHLDRFETAGEQDFEIHVWKGKKGGGTELGAFGSDGWFAKHSLGDDITVPQNIENHLKGIAIDTMRTQGRIGPKGVDDVTGDNWRRPRIAPGTYPG
ncbi:DUF6531 domain-containing protein [Catenulispora rubra]|uniref:DUF6531 domain-containing protein n=1 Tax=Catenulispora rubra TaxID=280293 RepID=UPI001891F362|nr:DUF6531 domain-containing protein [Catenulispora rubra]